MKSACVYWIHLPEHTDMFTQGYIGITNNINNRFEAHKNRPTNNHMKFAINKYGWDMLIKEVILIASNSYCLAVEAKIRAEKYIGWNIVEGGGCPPKAQKGMGKGRAAWNKGRSLSTETKAKLSAALRGRLAWNKGIITPISVKNKQSIAKLGKQSPRLGAKLSDDTKSKISASKKGFRLAEEVYKKQALSRTGFKHEIVECPHCHKTGGASAMPRWHFNNCREKV